MHGHDVRRLRPTAGTTRSLRERDTTVLAFARMVVSPAQPASCRAA
jgi:hypothetical protein